MYQWLFRNKWVAIAFVILTLVSVQALVGHEGDDSVISRTQSQVIQQRQRMQDQADSLATDPASVPPPEVIRDRPPVADETGWVDDDELIDDAEGFDPTPDVEQPDDPSADIGDDNSKDDGDK